MMIHKNMLTTKEMDEIQKKCEKEYEQVVREYEVSRKNHNTTRMVNAACIIALHHALKYIKGRDNE
jgi:hypothetical protein